MAAALPFRTSRRAAGGSVELSLLCTGSLAGRRGLVRGRCEKRRPTRTGPAWGAGAAAKFATGAILWERESFALISLRISPPLYPCCRGLGEAKTGTHERQRRVPETEAAPPREGRRRLCSRVPVFAGGETGMTPPLGFGVGPRCSSTGRSRRCSWRCGACRAGTRSRPGRPWGSGCGAGCRSSAAGPSE